MKNAEVNGSKTVIPIQKLKTYSLVPANPKLCARNRKAKALNDCSLVFILIYLAIPTLYRSVPVFADILWINF